MLPVGGVRDEVLAARCGGIRHVLLPARNLGDLDELASDAAEGLRFTFVETIGDVLFALFPGSGDGVDVPPERRLLRHPETRRGGSGVDVRASIPCMGMQYRLERSRAE